MKKQMLAGMIGMMLFLATGAGALARSHAEYSKVIRRDYPVNADVQVILDNKFGKIHVNTTDQNTVSVEIKITAVASDESTAAKILDKVLIMASGSASQVEIRTSIDEGGFSGRSRVTIDYTVSMPASGSLNLTNKFGDVYLGDLNGKAKLNLSYGNMEVSKLNNGDNLVDVRFGKANIDNIKGAVVTLKYSELAVDYAGSMRLDAKYSNLRADKIIAINANLEGGSLKVDRSSVVNIHSKFTDNDLDVVDQSIDLDLQYGNFEVGEMPADFTSINVTNKYGNVSITLPSTAAYRLDADLRYCDLDLPKTKSKFSFYSTTPTSKTFKGLVGTEDENVKQKITIRSEYGNISLE
jgi:hypothetical protein